MKKRKLRLLMADALERFAWKLRRQVQKEEMRRRRAKRVKGGADGLLTFLKIEFSDGGYAYSYLAVEDIFCVGDRVNAPVGDHGHMLHGTVKEVLHLPPEQAPYPIEKIKTVAEIVRCAEDAAPAEDDAPEDEWDD